MVFGIKLTLVVFCVKVRMHLCGNPPPVLIMWLQPRPHRYHLGDKKTSTQCATIDDDVGDFRSFDFAKAEALCSLAYRILIGLNDVNPKKSLVIRILAFALLAPGV
jgi:hypothetical protein